jgi:hypothetical protein
MAEKSAGGTATRSAVAASARGLVEALGEATRLLQGSLTPGDSPRLAPTRFEDWLAIHQPEGSFS